MLYNFHLTARVGSYVVNTVFLYSLIYPFDPGQLQWNMTFLYVMQWSLYFYLVTGESMTIRK